MIKFQKPMTKEILIINNRLKFGNYFAVGGRLLAVYVGIIINK